MNGLKDLLYLLWIAVLSSGVYFLFTAMLWLVKWVVIGVFLYYCWWFTRQEPITRGRIRSRFFGFFSFFWKLLR